MSVTEIPEEVRAQQAADLEEEMRAGGVQLEEPVQADYFGFDETLTITLPDGKSYVEHKVLNEGQRRNYLNKTNRDMTIDRQGAAKIRVAAGDDKHALLEIALVGWNLKKGGIEVPFNDKYRNEFLKSANPRVVDLIEKEVRKANPWLLAEMSVEDIDKEIANLQEMREARAKEEAGKTA